MEYYDVCVGDVFVLNSRMPTTYLTIEICGDVAKFCRTSFKDLDNISSAIISYSCKEIFPKSSWFRFRL